MRVFSHYVNYRFSNLLLNCSCTAIYTLPVTHPHEFCLTSTCQYRKFLFFFFRFNVRTTSFESRWDAPWRVKLLDFEAWPNICQIRHYPKSFRGDVTGIDLVREKFKEFRTLSSTSRTSAHDYSFVIGAPVNPRSWRLPAIQHSRSTSRNRFT